MPAIPRQYELVYIVHPDRSEEQVQQVISKYNNLITSQGGEVERTDVWERRRLAYEIKGQSEGVYIVCVFRGLPNVEAELSRVFRISEDTLRHIIVRPDVEIDTSVPSVQPRDYSARPSQMSHAGGPAHSPVAVVEAAPVTEPAAESAEPADSVESAEPVAESEAAEPAPAESEPDAPKASE
jgi:small subunit ribosomal protein S6